MTHASDTIRSRPLHDAAAPAAEARGAREALLVIVVASLLLGLVYVFAVRPGTPGDEPSHFDTIQFYARHARLPVLGQPGVSYEGQMGPLY